MAKSPRLFRLTITAAEAAVLQEPAGEGGHQDLHAAIVEQLANGNLTVTLSDEQLGKLVRYMTQYGSGGFQGRLRKAFRRALIEMF